MSLNNPRGFPSILWVNFSILYTAGETKLSKNGKKNMRFFDILWQSTQKMEQCLWHACREKTCLAFALSRQQRVCNCAPQNVPLYNLYRNYCHKLLSNWYNFLTISKSSVFSILFYLFIYLFCNVSFFSSFSESSKYVQNRFNRYGRNAICACSAYACINVWIFSREF